MSGQEWKAAARKELRATIRAALEPDFACAFASPSTVILREPGVYGIVTLQTSNTSLPDAWEVYINYGASTDAWFAARGYGPPKPRSDADCQLRDRHTPDPHIFPDSQFQRLRIPRQEWASDNGRARLTSYLTKVTTSEIAPWIRSAWATLS